MSTLFVSKRLSIAASARLSGEWQDISAWGIQEAIEFLVEQLQFGLHQATLPSGDVLPLSAETSIWSGAQPLAHKQRGHCSQFFLVRTASWLLLQRLQAR